ncbi:MAG: 23S rRNA (guanosine(2251)-2'-O)-methyltransferase RlmB [Bacteroidia bacterium]
MDEQQTTNNKQQTIFGIRAIQEALDAGIELNKVLIQKNISNPQIDLIISVCKKKNVPFQFVPKESSTFNNEQNHQGIVALASPVSYQSLEEIILRTTEKGEIPLFILLDRITDVRNFGAVARSAFCAGAHGIILPESGSVQVNADAIKTSAGALLNIPVCREKNFKTTMEMLHQYGIKTVACTEKANKEIPFIDLTGPVCLILGSEEKGISNEVLRKCEAIAKIPLDKGVASLNVSVAAGIVLYETIRQRMKS